MSKHRRKTRQYRSRQYRSHSHQDISHLLEKARECVEAMTPAERAEMHEAQRQSWVNGEKALEDRNEPEQEQLMRETQASISKWATETFSGAGSTFRIVTRANEEMAELLRKISTDAPAEEIVEEAADVAIVLCRAADHLIEGDILDSYLNDNDDEACDDEACDARITGNSLLIATRANKVLAELADATSCGHRPVQYRIDVLVELFFCLYDLANSFNTSLCDAIDRKMAVNRARNWKLDGTGHGYHT